MGLGVKIRLLLGYRALNFFTYFFPSLIPVRSLRRRFRSWIDGGVKDLHRLRYLGDFELKEIDGVTVAVRDDVSLGCITTGRASTEASIVFGGDYHFATQGRVIVIDIGMNFGFASLYFALRDNVEAVYGFEPVPTMYKYASFNFRINPKCVDKIQAFNYGLGDSEKEVTIDFSESMSGSTSTIANPPEDLLVEMQHHQSSKISVQIKDAATEIGNIIKHHPNERVVIKCDCEGAEKEIFARLDKEGLLSAIDIILMEYHFEYDQFITPLLDKYGFSYFKRNDSTTAGLIRAVKT